MAKATTDVMDRMAMPLALLSESIGADRGSDFKFVDRVSVYQQRVRDFLAAYLPAADGSSAELHKAMRYGVFGKGKHIRPLLTYASGEVLGVDPDCLDPLAAAVELVHAFSLIHDDLPAMDNDDLRRGHPTAHVVYGEALAILAGDALHTSAFHLLSSNENLSRRPGPQNETIRILAQASGSLGMTGGQAMDMAMEGKQPRANELEAMYLKKTGQLIRASIAMPCAWSEQADPFGSQQLLRFAGRIGLAFQIRDDLLEYVSNDGATGKSTRSDIANGKATYPGLFGVARARNRADELYSEAMSCLDFLGQDAAPLRQLANFIIRRKG